jgi:hypothetical protein
MNSDKKTNSHSAFDSPLKWTSSIGALARQEDESATENYTSPPWVSSSGNHDTAKLDPSKFQLNPCEFKQLSVHCRRVALLEKFSLFCLVLTRGWITELEAEAFYRRIEYVLTEGTCLMQMENVVQRNKDYLEKLQERQTAGNLSTYLQNLEASMGPEVMKNFYFFRCFVVNLLSSDEHVRKISHLNSMFDCLIITKKIQGQQVQGGEQKEINTIMKKPIFYLRQCIETIEGKKFESLEMALENSKLCAQAKDVWHVSYQSLSNEEQLDAKRSCELRDETLSNITFTALWMHRCWPQIIQYYIGSHQIKHNKLLDLREGYMIGNEVVDSYFALLNSRCNNSSEFFVSDLHQLGKNYSEHDIELKALFNILKRKKILLFPNHVDEMHFQLAMITMKDNLNFSLDIFDSIHVTLRAHKEKYYALVLELMSKIMLAGGISNYEVEGKSFPFANVQKNGYDCGIFMCMIAAALTGAIDVKWYEIDQEFITSKNCRASICASLITGQIQKPLP